jgi:alpha-glucosidase (family GH31 glycosyl hydrolase)
MVAIVDPHIKRDSSFPIYAESLDLDIIVKQADAKTDYEGWCWTGSSAWVDFFNEKSWGWWRGLFQFDKWTVRLPASSFVLLSIFAVGTRGLMVSMLVRVLDAELG